MDFVNLQVFCGEDLRDIVLAELSLFPFDAFEENDQGVLASCPIAAWNEEEVKETLEKYNLTYTFEEVAKVNWNVEWEKNYDPVIVGDQCIVRATFHPARPEFPYEIIITPKMSFGTGHHATTYQVLARQMQLDHEGKRVLDVGCGTGALAIMAWKRGAKEVSAIDNDPWCIENSQENFSINNCEQTQLFLGSIEAVDTGHPFDIILANINKNVLMNQMETYAARLKPNGYLLISGFYTEDITDLVEVAKTFGLIFQDQSERNQWAMVTLMKGS